ncbi:MAG: hypothetical protein WBQ11_15040, partial [Isosphaeraceae bacterium]
PSLARRVSMCKDAKLSCRGNNADPRGRLRLNCIGTIQDLARLGVRLQEGLKFSLHDEEMEAEGEVHYSGEERIWVAKIDWESIRQTST